MKALIVAMIIMSTTAFAQDSTKAKASLQILPRVHYGGYFPFTGALLNHSPVVDVNVFYERKALGFFLFQSVDLKDRHSYVNYMQPGLFATMKLDPTFKVRGFVGYIFSQARGFRDPDSDYYAATSFYWDPTKQLSIQNTVLYYDITLQHKIANRLAVSWTSTKFKADLFVWNRIVLGEKRQAVSASVAFTFPIIPLGEKTKLQFTTAYMWYMTKYKPSFALDKGFLFTAALPINVM